MTRRSAVFAVVLVTALAPVVTSWLLGDLSCECPGRARPLDTIFDAPPLNDTMTAIVGGASTAAVFVALVLIGSALRRHVVVFDDIRVAVPLVIGGLYAGLTYRVVTAGVIGANIGGGFLLLATPPVALLLAVWAVLWRPRRGNRRPPSTLTTRT